MLSPIHRLEPDREKPQSRVQFECDIARSPQDVTDAWRVVYGTYLRSGYIDPNPFEVFTFPHALQRNALVALARSEGRAVVTMSVVGDGPLGLPLDRVYPEELAALRHRSERICEVGLFAHDGVFTAPTALLVQLVSLVTYFGKHLGGTKFVVGVNPKRMRFWHRAFGFDQLSTARTYQEIRDAPVVMLDRPADLSLNQTPLIAQLHENPVPRERFEGRINLQGSWLKDSAVGDFLRWQREASTKRLSGLHCAVPRNPAQAAAQETLACPTNEDPHGFAGARRQSPVSLLPKYHDKTG